MTPYKVLLLGNSAANAQQLIRNHLTSPEIQFEFLVPGNTSRRIFLIRWLLTRDSGCMLYTDAIADQKKHKFWLLFLSLANASEKFVIEGNGKVTDFSTRVSFLPTLFSFLTEQVLSLLIRFGLVIFLPVYKSILKLFPKTKFKKQERKRLAFLRTNFWFGLKVGGSVSHIKGFTDAIQSLGNEIHFLSSDKLENIIARTDIIQKGNFFSHSAKTAKLAYNLAFYTKAKKILKESLPAFLYHRHDELTFSNVLLARSLNIPLILEFNSSEVWKKKHWGRNKNTWFLKQCEEIALLGANHIFTVSDVNKRNLMDWYHIPSDKITVNPNGVDPKVFYPDEESGKRIRKEYGIQENIVVGFVGTFGIWHGVDVLASVMIDIIRKNPKIHFFWVGDGIYKKSVIDNIEKYQLKDNVTLTGKVAHAEIPAYLNACDILVSPHTPQVDGAEFFGSPTKLFEYMAVGKGIVASNLGQIGQVLDHMKDAILVEPGNKNELAKKILKLSNDAPLQRFLGNNARLKAIECYSWETNAKRTLKAFDSLIQN